MTNQMQMVLITPSELKQLIHDAVNAAVQNNQPQSKVVNISRKWMSPGEAAKHTGYTTKTLAGWRRDGFFTEKTSPSGGTLYLVEELDNIPDLIPKVG